MKLVGQKREAVKALQEGKVVALPTDTVYGFFANAFSSEAVKKIFKIKKRSLREPVGIFVASLEEARKYAKIGEKEAEVFLRYLPGQVTFIFEKKASFPEGVGTKETIGIRIPDHPLFEEILGELSFPLAQTSANVSGEKTPKKGEDVFKKFKNRPFRPDVVLKGEASSAKPSTVVDLSSEPRILRKGAVEVDL